jgi:hypothetical protein
MSLGTSALITAQEYRDFIGQTDANAGREQPTIETHINSASTFIARYCHRTFIVPASAADWIFDGNGTQEKYAADWPILASPTPTLKWFDGATWQTVTGAWTYTAANGLLYFTDANYFWGGKRNYKLTCKAGYAITDVPQDLKYACAQFIFRALRKIVDKQEGVASESFDAHSISFSLDKLPPDLKMILDSHKAVVIG